MQIKNHLIVINFFIIKWINLFTVKIQIEVHSKFILILYQTISIIKIK